MAMAAWNRNRGHYDGLPTQAGRSNSPSRRGVAQDQKKNRAEPGSNQVWEVIEWPPVHRRRRLLAPRITDYKPDYNADALAGALEHWLSNCILLRYQRFNSKAEDAWRRLAGAVAFVTS